jgi:hypothetical protein
MMKRDRKLFMTQAEVFEYVSLYGKMPSDARIRFKRWGKKSSSMLQRISGTITFHIRSMDTGEWIEESYYAHGGSAVTYRRRFMERMIAKTNNLSFDRYFTWKPDYNDKP